MFPSDIIIVSLRWMANKTTLVQCLGTLDELVGHDAIPPSTMLSLTSLLNQGDSSSSSPSPSPSAIRTAYNKAMLVLHPDRHSALGLEEEDRDIVVSCLML